MFIYIYIIVKKYDCKRLVSIISKQEQNAYIYILVVYCYAIYVFLSVSYLFAYIVL